MAGDSSRRVSVSVSADAVRARAAALGLSLALDDRAAHALALRVQDAAADAERMGELGLDDHEPAVEFRPLAARKE